MKLGPEYYDSVFLRSDSPFRLFAQVGASPYYPLYTMILDRWVQRRQRILDVGCGTGQFLMLAERHGCVVTGIDFSPVGIRLAREQVPGGTFFLQDIETDRTLIEGGEYDVITFLEVLEHLEDDLGVLQAVPVGKTVVLSVPNFRSKSHVRHFMHYRGVIERYKHLVRMHEGENIRFGRKNRTYVFCGRRI